MKAVERDGLNHWIITKERVKIDEALNAEGTCACSAIRCTKGCSIAEGNGVTVAVNFSRAVPSVASTPEGETMPEGG